MVDIRNLRDSPEYAAILAWWAYSTWFTDRDISFNVLLKFYQQRTNVGLLPETWIALVNDFPVGMITLKENDLWTRKDLNPWLSSLYVAPEFRRQGIARHLIEQVIRRASELNYDNLYLFLGQHEQTELEKYYLARGWSFYGDDFDNDNLPTKIFCYKN